MSQAFDVSASQAFLVRRGDVKKEEEEEKSKRGNVLPSNNNNNWPDML